MIEITVLAAVVVVVLAALLVVQARDIRAERSEWRAERRFLTDRAIAKHMGEVAMLEREDTRKNGDIPDMEAHVERQLRPLIEGLS